MELELGFASKCLFLYKMEHNIDIQCHTQGGVIVGGVIKASPPTQPKMLL